MATVLLAGVFGAVPQDDVSYSSPRGGGHREFYQACRVVSVSEGLLVGIRNWGVIRKVLKRAAKRPQPAQWTQRSHAPGFTIQTAN
ncbi:hypothetical protein RCH07_002127 [Arthrobacter sp. CG_A4]|nr:hypothetical protein [Arthrobacter sp. CG_A4]